MVTPAGATVEGLRERLVAIAHRAYRLGLVPGVSGNLSVRLPGEPMILIKATGKCFGDMTPDDTLVIDLEGNILDRETSLRPSKERWFHLAIYQARPDVGAVVHLHPPHALTGAGPAPCAPAS